MQEEKIYGGTDRRKFVRIPYDAVMRYKVCNDKKKKDCKKDDCREDGKHRYLNADSKNLSSGGILLTTKEHFPLYTILEIEMDIPSVDGYTTVKILGEIARTSEIKGKSLYDNGISFYKVNEKDKSVIEDFMEFSPDMSEAIIEEL